jgi:hypothetical protein
MKCTTTTLCSSRLFQYPFPRLPEHPQHVALALARIRALISVSALRVSNRTRGSEEEDLDRNRKARVQGKHHDKQDLARLCFRGAKHRVQVAQEKERREREAQRDEDVVEDCNSICQRPIPNTEHTQRKRRGEDLLATGLQLTSATTIHTKFAYP